MKSLKTLTTLTLLTSLFTSVPSFSAEKVAKEFNPWQLRLRAININPDSESSLVSSGSAAAGSANAEQSSVPELDITYFINKNIAAELILATSEHEVNALNGTDLGTVGVLPPTLTLQYHFSPESTVRPYVGAGLNYTMFYNVDKGAGLGRVEYQDGVGYAVQAGVDLMKDEHWGVNLDVKRIFLNTDVSVNNGAINADVDLDPWVLGAGITYKF